VEYRFRNCVWCVLVSSLFVASIGCEPPAQSGPKFIPNKVYAYKLELENELPMDSTLQDIQVVLNELFGTASDPRVPKLISESEDFKEIIDLARLKRACGADPAIKPVDAVYVRNCINCHAWEGSGRGPGSAGVDPYPRDFRAGVFKYKSTTRLAKPLKADLTKTVKYGLAGSGMGAYDKLSEEQLADVIDFVIYLSIRGELERKLLDYAISEFDLEAGEDGKMDRWVAESNGQLVINADQQETIDELLTEIVTAWQESSDSLIEFEKPTDMPILAATPESWEKVTSDEALLASVTKGKELFLGATAACASCHGPGGLGDGRTNDYDDWTKEWTVRINVDPTDKDALIPFLLRGALPPKNIKPRNLRELALRGGRTPEDLYRRVRHGIAGAPMPAIQPVSSPDELGLTEKDLWHVVNYVLAMPVEPKPWPAAPIQTEAAPTEPETTASAGL